MMLGVCILKADKNKRFKSKDSKKWYIKNFSQWTHLLWCRINKRHNNNISIES